MERLPNNEYLPGWNDPPMLNYSQSNPPPKSRIMNKRVAFPQGIPSPSHSNPKVSDPSSLPSSKTINICVENLYIKASENFQKILETISDEKIKEQTWQMLSAWQSGKFSENVQNILVNLSNSILENDLLKLNEFHLKFMMENSPDVKTYASALNYIVNVSK